MLMTSTKDVNGEILLDLAVHVETESLEAVAGDIKATLEGETYGSTPIVGTASIRAVQPETWAPHFKIFTFFKLFVIWFGRDFGVNGSFETLVGD